MSAIRRVVTAALVSSAVALAGAQNAVTRDYGALTCRDFVGSGKDNMAVIIWWLRGHHAGKTGVSSFDPKDAYAKRLGFFCGSNPSANLIEASERILADLDRGI